MTPILLLNDLLFWPDGRTLLLFYSDDPVFLNDDTDCYWTCCVCVGENLLVLLTCDIIILCWHTTTHTQKLLRRAFSPTHTMTFQLLMLLFIPIVVIPLVTLYGEGRDDRLTMPLPCPWPLNLPHCYWLDSGADWILLLGGKGCYLLLYSDSRPLRYSIYWPSVENWWTFWLMRRPMRAGITMTHCHWFQFPVLLSIVPCRYFLIIILQLLMTVETTRRTVLMVFIDQWVLYRMIVDLLMTCILFNPALIEQFLTITYSCWYWW